MPRRKIWQQIVNEVTEILKFLEKSQVKGDGFQILDSGTSEPPR